MCHGAKPHPERLLTLVAYDSRVITEGLKPSEGNEINHILSEEKASHPHAMNSDNTIDCHHPKCTVSWDQKPPAPSQQLHVGH